MIPVHRGPEPSELREKRRTHLARAVEAFNAHGSPSQELSATLKGYGVAREALYLRQHKKCAYCERRPGLDGQPTEHFRPKAERHYSTASDHKVVDALRYWWLCWTWENLLFGCHTCNGAARKGNWFDVESGTDPLDAPTRPVTLPLPSSCVDLSLERPLLLDPSESGFQPSRHLAWVPIDRTAHPSLWMWRLKPESQRGLYTLTKLGLKDRTDEVNNRFTETVWPRFRDEVHNKPPTQAVARWQALARALLRADKPLVLATWWQLQALRQWADRGGTSLPAPPAL